MQNSSKSSIVLLGSRGISWYIGLLDKTFMIHWSIREECIDHFFIRQTVCWNRWCGYVFCKRPYSTPYSVPYLKTFVGVFKISSSTIITYYHDSTNLHKTLFKKRFLFPCFCLYQNVKQYFTAVVWNQRFYGILAILELLSIFLLVWSHVTHIFVIFSLLSHR